MKKLVTILCLSAMASGLYAQGTITFANTAGTLFQTNSTARGGTAGSTATAALGYYYAVFTAASTVTSIDSNGQDLLSANWTFTGNYATNTAATTGGRLSGGSNIPTQQGWPAGQTNSFVVIGWSANEGGPNVTNILAELQGSTFSGGQWAGGHWAADGGYFGITTVGFGEAGGGPSALPQFGLFGSGPTTAGNPITTPTSMFVVTVPEPGTFALAGLGAAALLIFRRRK